MYSLTRLNIGMAACLLLAAGCNSQPAASPVPAAANNSPAVVSGKATTQPASPTPETHPPVPLSIKSVAANQYFDEYQQGAATLDKYRGGLVEIKGSAILVGSAHGLPFIRLGIGKDEITGVHCFTQDAEPWGKVVTGQEVTLRGKVPDRLFGAQLADCEIVSIGPSPALTATAASLATELAADPKATNSKYEGKEFFFSGTVDGFDDEYKNSIYLKGNGPIRVRCVFDPYGEEKQIPTLKIGDQIDVVGHYGYYGTDNEVLMQQCIMYDPQKAGQAKPMETPATVPSTTAPVASAQDSSLTKWIPPDAIAAVVLHPRRVVSSPLGSALMKLGPIAAKLNDSAIPPQDVEQAIYAMGAPTDESENNCTIVRFARPISKDLLLREEFGGLEYEAVLFAGKTYYRYASSNSEPVAESDSPSKTTASLIASYPEDLRNQNGHPDGSNQGTWHYLGSETNDPQPNSQEMKPLTWDAEKKRFQHDKRGKNNVFPSIGESLHPSPDQPYFPDLRWKSRIEAKVRVQGNFSKYANAQTSDGVRAFIYVDGQQQFANDIGPRDTKGVDFDFTATVHPDSVIDFLVGAKANPNWDSTKLTLTIENLSPGKTDMPQPIAEQNKSDLTGSAFWIVDDQTTIRTDQRRLRQLISEPAKSASLADRLGKLDMNHDLIAVVDLTENRSAADSLKSEMPRIAAEAWGEFSRDAQFAVTTIDLTGDTLLNVQVTANDKTAAAKIESAADSILDAVQGIRNFVPADSPLLPLVKQMLSQTQLTTNGSQVDLKVPMPDQLLAFVQNDAEPLVASLKGNPPRPVPMANPGNTRPDFAMPPAAPESVALREVPKDHPDYQDLALPDFDCRIFFPKRMKRSNSTTPIADGDVQVTSFEADNRVAIYLFEVYTYPAAFVAKAGAQSLSLKTRGNLIKSAGGQLKSGNPINVEADNALEFVYDNPIDSPAGRSHCRIIVRGNRVYVFEISGPQTDPREIAFYFDSFSKFDVPGLTPSKPLVPTKPRYQGPQLPIPSAADRDEALQLVRSLYQKEFEESRTAEDKVALAQSMLERAGQANKPAERFVLLDVARKTAAGAGGVDQTLEAVAMLSERFQVESLSLKTQSLAALSEGSLTTEARIQLAQEMITTADDAIAADQFDSAAALLEKGAALARAAREFNLAKSANDLLNEVNQLKTAFAAIQNDLQTLKTEPADPDANLAVGQFRCLMLGDWETGLPMLARSNSPDLQATAKEDLANPATPDSQVAVADRWYELSQNVDGTRQKHLQLRAAYWYRAALPQLAGLQKDAAEKRLGEMKYVAESVGPERVLLKDLPIQAADVLINDDKGNFREERLKGEIYPEVLWAHAKDDSPSHYEFDLNRQFTTMTGKAAINDVQSVSQTQRPQVFAIYGDRRLLWKSEPMQKTLDSQDFRVNVSGVKTLHLFVDGGGYGGHALWVDVVLEKKH